MIGEKEEIKLPVSLRDYFAGQALSCLSGKMAESISELEIKNNETCGNRFGKYAYRMADAMIQQRNK